MNHPLDSYSGVRAALLSEATREKLNPHCSECCIIVETRTGKAMAVSPCVSCVYRNQKETLA